jgi:hypothetical protein
MDGRGLVYVAQNRDKVQALVEREMKLRVP